MKAARFRGKNMNPMTLPTLWFQEESIIPLFIADANGDPVTGLAFGNVAVKYARKSDLSLQTLAVSLTKWAEKGEGFYTVTFDGVHVNEVGPFMMNVTPNTVTGATFRGISTIEKREEDRLLEHPASGYSVGTVGNAINGSLTQEVFVNPQYDYENSKLIVTCWLHIGGQRIATPTNCEVIITQKESTGDTLIADITSIVPDADGVFVIEKTGVVLEQSKNYSIVGTITYNGVTYTSIGGMRSHN